ncbi:MAG: VapC toxin family PIN domain ribonuclease [Nitrospira bacterium HGW-Nitrospira-1]|nr:MAG: VapC toxin family PIN domain ribonuclease [Nitrospira bacterium HGW-Nitrospira-1]
MTVFFDTSAFLAILNKDDANHQNAKRFWKELVYLENILITNNYVLVESLALIQRRLGMEPLRVFQEDVLPLINIEWIDKAVHEAGISALLTASRKKLSLVDCVSFEVMRNLGIRKVFAFDPHFEEQGFEVIS